MQTAFIYGGNTSLFSRFGNGSSSNSSSNSKTPTATRPNTSSGATTLSSQNTESVGSQGSSAVENLSRKTSTKPPKTPTGHKIRTPSISQNGTSVSPEKRPERTRSKSRGPPISLRSPEKEHSRRKSLTLTKTISNSVTSAHENLQPALTSAEIVNQSHQNSVRDSFTSTRAYSTMLANYGSGSYKQGVSYGSIGVQPAVVAGGAIGPLSPTLETITYQHIQEMASKRISTLDYLRKAHEGRVYWFNTILFTKADLSKIPYFEVRRLSRRATNYLLLGLSLPTVLDLNSNTPIEFLRTLNALLAEFESFQQIHPPDGSTSSLSRARIPQMFKRSMGNTGSKARRTSSAADIGLPFGAESYDTSSSAPLASFPAENELLPGEEYSYLLTPSLPFDPDFYETFATLCDVLIDCYQKLMQLVPSPKDCGPAVAEAFTNADKRIRKIIVNGVVKEFEEASRVGVKAEVAGVGKVVLGGLM